MRLTSVDPELEEKVELRVDSELGGRKDKSQGQVEEEGGVALSNRLAKGRRSIVHLTSRYQNESVMYSCTPASLSGQLCLFFSPAVVN